jgi:oligopeptide transport system permease protein
VSATWWTEAARRFAANRMAAGAAVIIGLLVLLAVLGGLLNPNDAERLDWSHIATAPTLAQAHWFGTDRLGRDLFVRTLAGARLSLGIGLIATAVSVGIGVTYGAICGYLGGRVDQAMMRIVEILSGLPLIFFVIFLTVILGRSLFLLFAAIGAVGWLTMARIVRGQALSIRQKEYIEAARAGGAGVPRILLRHVLPNLIGPVIVYATLTVPQVVLFESFLSFLGLGVQEPRASLGTLIAEGAAEMESAAWMLLIPGAYLTLLLLCLNIVGDGLRDALDEPDRVR